MFALFPYLTLYLQNLLGYSPFEGGVRLLPTTLLVFVVPLVTRTAVARIPQGVVLAGGHALARRQASYTSGFDHSAQRDE